MEFKVEKRIDNLGRIVLPKDMRDYYGINLNDKLLLVATDKGILISAKNEKGDKPKEDSF